MTTSSPSLSLSAFTPLSPLLPLPSKILRHDIYDQRRPAREWVASHAFPRSVVVLLPEIARGLVLSQDCAQKGVPQFVVQLLRLALMRACRTAEIPQGAQGQVVGVDPDVASPVGCIACRWGRSGKMDGLSERQSYDKAGFIS